MNTADSERLQGALEGLGFVYSNSKQDADLVVLNTCVVRQNAENKAVGTLTSLKPSKQQNPNKIIALMGCMVGPKTESLEKRFPYVDVFMQPQQYDPLLQFLSDKMDINTDGCIQNMTAVPSVTTFIPIIHGCDKFCSFCIIPYRRGREKSRGIEDITLESERLAARGVKEITLLGQNVDSYGHDLPGSTNLAQLLESINSVKGIERIRFLTSHPNDMDDNIIDAIANLDKVCENINLPFQAGHNDVLKNMRRGYTNEEYRSLIQKIRDKIPNVTLSTDLIVGFCGETNEQFQSTVDLITDLKFDKIHSAAYSTREGTIADRKMIDNVPQEVKKTRLKIINDTQEKIVRELNLALLGKTFEVLIEGEKEGKSFGRNRNDKIVFLDSECHSPGELINVKINKTSPWYLNGTVITQ
jgi:tRNA-2-methylthio-N6-dimethylallyladenosine synthase